MHIPGANRSSRLAVKALLKRIAGVIWLQSLIVFLFVAAPWYLAVAILLVFGAWYFGKDRLSRKHIETISFGFIVAAAITVLAILIIILGYIIINGFPAISWEFLTQPPQDLGRAGGIFPAIVGTLYLVAGAILIALPLGVGAALYLVEYTREGRITRLIRTGVDLLNGTPSIVFGLFGFAFIVLYLTVGVSLLAGQITLALMILPTVIRTTEESLKNIPAVTAGRESRPRCNPVADDQQGSPSPGSPGYCYRGDPLYRESGRGDCPDHVHRGCLFIPVPSHSEFQPVMALPYHLFILATNVPGASTNQYGTALVLLLLS